MRVASREVVAGQWRVHLREAGEGPAVLLVPSMVIGAHAYLRLVRRLARRFRVVVPEMPGSGWSSRTAHMLSGDEHARVLSAVMDTFGIERATLIGHSLSGASVVAFARLFPARVDDILLIDVTGGLAGTSLARMFLSRALEVFLEPRVSLVAWWDVLVNLVRHWSNVWSGVRSAVATDLAPELARVEVPVRLVWGRDDRTTPLWSAQRLAGNAELVVVPGTHDWLIEHPDRLVALLADRGTGATLP